MTVRRVVRFVVPDGLDDPRRVSGGNVYDRHVRDGLRGRGWTVETVEAADGGAAASALRDAGGDTLVLVDGLVGAWAPAALELASRRATVVVLAHMIAAAFPDATVPTASPRAAGASRGASGRVGPASVEAERRMLACAHRVIVTSQWTAAELSSRGLADPSRVTVAAPGVSVAEPGLSVAEPGLSVAEPAKAATQPARQRNLLCVGVVAPHKGQDTLLAALAQLPEADWTCEIVGSTESFPEFAAAVERDARALSGRVRLTGVLDGAALDEAYRRAAVLVAPSRVESAGMAIADARARGIPVIGADAGGIPDALAAGGGLLVRPGDPLDLAGTLQAWLTDPALRARLRAEAHAARTALPGWDDTVATIAGVLEAA